MNRSRGTVWYFHIIVFVILLFFSGMANAVVLNWEGAGNLDGFGNALWSDPDNWFGSNVPSNNDELIFSGTGNAVESFNDLNGLSIDRVVFGNTSNGESFVISGQQLQLTGSITTVATTDPDEIEDQIALNLLIGQNVAINTGAGHGLSMSGSISGAGKLTLNNGSNSEDDGTVKLSGLNTYTGGTDLQGGTVAVFDSNAFGSGDVTVYDRSNTNPRLEIGSSGLVLANTLILENQGGTKTLVFDIDGSGNTAEWAGDIVLNETGGNNNRLLVGEGETLTLSGDISGAGRLTLRRDTTGGDLVLSGDNTFEGGVRLEEGVLFIESDTALGTGLLSILDRGVTPVADFADGLTVANDILISNTGRNKRLRVDRDGAAATTLSGNIEVQETRNNQFDYEVGEDDTLMITGVISGVNGGEKIGGGTLILTNANTFGQDFTLSEGVLVLANDKALGSSTLTIRDTGETPILTLQDGRTYANDITVSNTGGSKWILINESGSAVSATLTGDIDIEETSARAFDFEVGFADELTVSGMITGATDAGIEKRGSGILRLTNGASDFAGPLWVSGGVVEAGKLADAGVASSIGTNSLIVLGSNDADGTLTYVGVGDSTDRQIMVGRRGSDNNRSGGAAILNNGTGGLVFTNPNFNVVDPASAGQVAARTLELGGSYVASTNRIEGAIIDNRAQSDGFVDESITVEKTGQGTWSLEGDNTYTGGTIVREGLLWIRGDSSGATGASIVEANARLGGDGQLGAVVAVDGSIEPGAGTLGVFSVGEISFNDSSSFGFDIDSSAAALNSADMLVVSSGLSANSTGNINLSGDAKLEINDVAFSPSAFDEGSVITLISYDGDWNGGLFSYDGLTLVNGGTFTAGLNTWQIDYDAEFAGTNFSQINLGEKNIVLTAVPEPSFGVLSIGLMVLGRVGCRRYSQQNPNRTGSC